MQTTYILIIQEEYYFSNISLSSFFISTQAVMSSDVAIAQFKYLERLLLVHGHWCYRRISSMVMQFTYLDSQNVVFHSSHSLRLMSLPLYLQICYFFYKNITFGFTIFLYEAFTSFSGQPVYNDWFLSLYNVFFSSLPVVALGVFDQDVSARLCLQVCSVNVLIFPVFGMVCVQG